MKDKIVQYFTRSESTKHILTLMSGTVIAQAIPVAITPILSRIYTEADFGLLSVYVSLASIVAVIATGRYEMAILLPEEDEDAVNIAALSLTIVTGFTLLSFLLVVFFHSYITGLLGNRAIGPWLYFVPVSIFFLGLFNVLTYFNNRLKAYKDIAKATIYKSVASAFIQISVGLLRAGATGLISGNIISAMVSNVRLLRNIVKDKVLMGKITFSQMKKMAGRYRNFPKFSMWAILANALSVHLVNLIIVPLYSTATLGFYFMVQRVLGLPVGLIGNSAAQVFMREASQEKQQYGNATKTFRSMFKKMLFVGFPSFLFLFFVIKFVFIFFLGENWAVAGDYARILVPYFFTKFISSPMSIMLIVFEKQKMELLVNVLAISVSVGTLLLTSGFMNFIYWFSGIMSVIYILLIFYYYRLSKGGANG